MNTTGKVAKFFTLAAVFMGGLTASYFFSYLPSLRLEMAKLALMGEFAVDSTETGNRFFGDRFTVYKVEDFPVGETLKMRLSADATEWLQKHSSHGLGEGMPIGTTPQLLHPRGKYDVQFDVVVWVLRPVFLPDGSLSYKADQYARRVVVPKDHPTALARAPGKN